MNKSAYLIFLSCLLSFLSLQASSPAKSIITYMDPDNKHKLVLYNDLNGKALLVVDCVEYPDDCSSYTDTLLLDDAGRIIRLANCGIYNGHKSLGNPILVDNPTTYWNLDDIVTMPFFKVEDHATLNHDEQVLVNHYKNMRQYIQGSDVEKALLDLHSTSIFTWIGFGLMIFGILAGIATFTMGLTSKGIKYVGGYIAPLTSWCGLYPVWSYLHQWFATQYTVGFVLVFTIINAVYANAVMNHIEDDRTLTNKQVKTPFYPAFILSIIVCIAIGYQYAWWGAILGYIPPIIGYSFALSRPKRCEECHRKKTLLDYDKCDLGTVTYEQSSVKGDPVVYRKYYENTYRVYVKRFRCSACGHIQADTERQEHLINSKFIRSEYLYTKKQTQPRASNSSSSSFPKVYEITEHGMSYTLTQNSKYSECDYTDQYGGRWYKGANGFRMVERGLHDTN